MTTYTITDKIGGTTLQGVGRYDLEAALRGLFPAPDASMTEEAQAAWAEAQQVCAALVAKLHAGDCYGEEEAYLQVSVVAERAKPGRPKVGEQINLRLPPDMIAAIDATARVEGTTRAEWIRRALAARLAAARS